VKNTAIIGMRSECQ